MVSEPSSASETTHQPDTPNKEATVTKGKGQNSKKFKFKLKGIWRETQLAKPKMPQDKYIPPYAGPLRLVQKSFVIDPEVLVRCNQLAFTHLRTIEDNKKDFVGILEEKKYKNLMKQEEKTLNTIYYLYKRNMMRKEMKLKKVLLRRALMARYRRKKVKDTKDQGVSRTVYLATPKKSFKSKPPQRGHWKPLEQMSRYMDLAEPLKRVEVPPKTTNEVSEAAKNYIATDYIVKLAQQPRRYDDLEPPLEANRPVPKSALTYKITPQIERLYVVKLRKEGTTSTPEDEIWKISPAALKYKATPRILQLAKPIERK